MGLPEKIVKFRTEKGLSSGQLAEEAGVSRAYLWQLETGGKSSPSLQILQRLSNVLGVSVSELCDVPQEPVQTVALPPGLIKFVQTRAQALGVRKQDIDTLKNTRFRGQQPDTPEDWELLFLFLKKWVK